jgi:thymidylate synthase
MLAQMIAHVKTYGVDSPSRNGPVRTLPYPVMVEVKNPKRRTLLCPVRRANPFFHVAEFVWMLSGSNMPEWIAQFNSRFVEYADTNNASKTPIIHGAYGHRWRSHFGQDQIIQCVRMLRNNQEDRRAVLQMWDGRVDLMVDHNDVPCNTTIYLRVIGGKLDMTVSNRSNDIIWGMCGANIVHMTLLQQLIAELVGVAVGKYYVMSNNAHVYLDNPQTQRLFRDHRCGQEEAWYETPDMLDADTTHYSHVVGEARQLMLEGPENDWESLTTPFFSEVAWPMIAAYKTKDRAYIDAIGDKNWCKAAQLWADWHNWL